MNQRHPLAESCATCRYFQPGSIFELCLHAESLYHIADKPDYHTCNHMRQLYGKCGQDRKLYS